MELIYAYTRQQAIEDGVLLHFEQFLQTELPDAEDAGKHLDRLNGVDGKFPLGELVITPAAAGVLRPGDVLNCLTRHRLGDWGQLHAEDVAANEDALLQQDRLFSVYHVPNKQDERQEVRFYIITEWNREATTVLLPGDY